MFSCISGKKPSAKHKRPTPEDQSIMDYKAQMDENLDLGNKIAGKVQTSFVKCNLSIRQIDTIFNEQPLPAKLPYTEVAELFKGGVVEDEPLEELFQQFEVECREVSDLPLIPLNSGNLRYSTETDEQITKEYSQASSKQIANRIEIKEAGNDTVKIEQSQQIETQTNSSPKPDDSQETISQDSEGLAINDRFSKYMINGRIEKAFKIFEKMTIEEKRSADGQGFTPVLLGCLMGIHDPKFIEVAKTLLYHEDVKIKTPGPMGWTPMQQAIFHKNIPLVVHIFKASYVKKRHDFEKVKLPNFLEVLKTLPDFNLQIDAKINSFLPLIDRLLPSDCLKISKIGQRIRMDSTLAGYENLSCKRRELSLIFNPSTDLQKKQQIVFPLYLLNRTKGTYTNVLQALDDQQMKLIIKDLMEAECINVDPKVESMTLEPATNLFGNSIMEQIGGYETQKYQLNVNYQSRTEKRKPPQKGKQLQEFEFLESWEKYKKKIDFSQKRKKHKKKEINLSVWLSKQFPFDFKHFIEIVRTLGFGNKMLEKVAIFFENKGIESLMSGFPVKIQIPLNYTLYADIEFSKYKAVTSQVSTLFEIPNSLAYQQRKKSQKTIERATKRLILANIYM